MTLSSGTKLGHYEIRSKIGEAGMGKVYLAHDTKLDRKVALKILPAELASNQDRMRRFVQEAKAAAALNHPNIATIHEIGESDSVNYIPMEFIEGATLREKIHQECTELKKLLKTAELDPGFASTYSALATVYRLMGKHAESVEAYAKLLDLIDQPQTAAFARASFANGGWQGFLRD